MTCCGREHWAPILETRFSLPTRCLNVELSPHEYYKTDMLLPLEPLLFWSFLSPPKLPRSPYKYAFSVTNREDPSSLMRLCKLIWMAHKHLRVVRRRNIRKIKKKSPTLSIEYNFDEATCWISGSTTDMKAQASLRRWSLKCVTSYNQPLTFTPLQSQSTIYKNLNISSLTE